ncbi:hypothetical protein ASPZODRAFT_1031493 [Penicilliopsis zonata CBS 506.65]|uniref:Uncharacterized protein n=1 Tax=Penicilliopsis zonata CBS 506.65 TaxID=1073090 RepID=A0A1L9SRQ7_9EURO|nr:hypothetical protein ASPZODRAFT_1031493 [Penicilliopsis zonata CBS 506.65]OJJ49797.1 hypothetical protein ASPZODRAFT_1031493 [Penicilliopsis zonata CBS 506.65]
MTKPPIAALRLATGMQNRTVPYGTPVCPHPLPPRRAFRAFFHWVPYRTYGTIPARDHCLLATRLRTSTSSWTKPVSPAGQSAPRAMARGLPSTRHLPACLITGRSSGAAAPPGLPGGEEEEEGAKADVDYIYSEAAVRRLPVGSFPPL